MNIKKAVGFGVALWILMFVVVSVLIALKLYPGAASEIVIALVAGVISYILAGYVKPKDKSEALKYGASWVVVGVVLDGLITTRFDPEIFGMWTLWLGYVLVLLAPAIRVHKK